MWPTQFPSTMSMEPGSSSSPAVGAALRAPPTLAVAVVADVEPEVSTTPDAVRFGAPPEEDAGGRAGGAALAFCPVVSFTAAPSSQRAWHIINTKRNQCANTCKYVRFHALRIRPGQWYSIG